MNASIFVLVALFAVIFAAPQGKDYPIKLQPELDSVDVESYLRNERLLDFQLKCVIYDGPCDSVGRWIKPRVPAALLGNCLECTPKQKDNMSKILSFIQEKRPEAYRASVEKYLKEQGINVPSDGSSTTAASS